MRPFLVRIIEDYWGILLLLFAWQAWVVVNSFNPIVMPTPTAVLNDLVSYPMVYLSNVGITLAVAVFGLIAGMTVGTGLVGGQGQPGFDQVEICRGQRDEAGVGQSLAQALIVRQQAEDFMRHHHRAARRAGGIHPPRLHRAAGGVEGLPAAHAYSLQDRPAHFAGLAVRRSCDALRH